MAETNGLHLRGLTALLLESKAYRDLVAVLTAHHIRSEETSPSPVGKGQGVRSLQQRAVVPENGRALLLAALAADLRKPIMVLTPKPEDAQRLAEEMEAYLGTDGAPARALLCPEYDALPFERLAVDEEAVRGRIRALAALASPTRELPPVVVASVAAATHLTLDPKAFTSAMSGVRVGQKLEIQPLLARWAALGYRSERAVEVPGTFSLRGGILDVFSPDTALPARIELLGNEVESIRLFDPSSQRSQETVDAYAVLPASEVLSTLGDSAQARRLQAALRRDGTKDEAWEQTETDLALLLEGGVLDESLMYAGFFNRATLLDYLPADGLLVLDEPMLLEQAGEAHQLRAEQLYEAKRNRGDLPEGFPSPWAVWGALRGRLQDARLALEWLTAAHRVEDNTLGISPAPAFWGKLETFAAAVRKHMGDGHRVVVLSHHAQRFSEVLAQRGAGGQVVASLDAPPASGSVTLLGGSPLSQGLVMPIVGGDLVLLTDAEILGQVKRARPVRRHAIRREAFLSELSPGMYVVHVDHGIGRFTGTRKVSTEQGEKEYLILEYAEADKLFVPTDALDRLSPYIGPGDAAPALTRLGTQEWLRAKERAKGAAAQMAKELLDLYAARELVQRRPYSADTPWQQQLEDSFPYVETPDQAQAIQDVKADLERERPMDRLICGDVGYGKTEVALRAAFKAAQEGYQVALLCPTTVLAQQHYSTFTSRLAPYPISVEVLHRFRPKEEMEKAIEAINEGKVDIVIGTHRVLQKDVKFRRLGLVIVDDEQKFGVVHKERLKQLRKEVDVLTLSATPIPRTLYMAMAGVRDMSTMETPPESRLAVRTFVANFSDDLVREAVLRELDRGGQVFFLHNRVKDIYEWAQRIQSLVPQARVVVGHGQMHEDELAEAMEAFSTGKADVLVCTTIIEAGLDIPNANTLLVNRPELLGLAQMYQLRGRVGRSSQQAYAYFLLSPGRRLTDEAQKRLRAILAHQELGAGFRIAMRDLEIRGAGNILGDEQSGHIQAVGFDLYVRMLEEAIKELKAATGQASAEPPPSPFALPMTDVTVDLPLPAFIPESYLPDLPQRLAVYQRLARATAPDELPPVHDELADRFGPPPESVEDLFYTVQVKTLAAKAGVQSVTHREGLVVMQMKGDVGGAREAFQRDLRGLAQVGPSQVRVPMRGKWKDVLVWVLERTLAFEERMLAMASEAHQPKAAVLG